MGVRDERPASSPGTVSPGGQPGDGAGTSATGQSGPMPAKDGGKEASGTLGPPSPQGSGIADARQRIEVLLGDIVTLPVDAIVNAANNSLLGGSGVDGAIHHAAGPALLAECRTLGGCSTGDAKITRGYNLPARHIIHTVGPVWYGGSRNEPELLARCYRRCIEVALAHGVQTLAFPAISTGVYGYPHLPAARIAVREVASALRRSDSLKKVLFVCFDRTTYQTYQSVLAQENSAELPLGPTEPRPSQPSTSTSGLLRVPASAPPAAASVPPGYLRPPQPSNPPHASPLVRARFEERVRGALWGAIVGDALGVPVEFKLRSVLDQAPVRDLQGYGTYKVPPGTWSEDSTLLLCTLYSLLQQRLDLADLAQRFVRFLDHAYMTPTGQVFDISSVTATAIGRMRSGVPPEEAGSESDTDNGPLSRVLPLALRFPRESDSTLALYAQRAATLTHRHSRVQIGCGYYAVLTKALLDGESPHGGYRRANQFARAYYDSSRYAEELQHYHRLLDGRIELLARDQVQSSGQVVQTLEAGVWCLLSTQSYEDAVLRAVNLGGDTDTIASVTGGLAGLCYGVSAIPEPWRQAMARAEDIEDLISRFVARVLPIAFG
ncbi:MAG: O-acetyl-ADP-ribose deacetylase [Myxococcales bacterium]|nr:O-acetyl-ADP-ribose deacetylase [Myxococcales bacterium]